MFRLTDYWVWDSWIADDGDLFHLFFLKADRALADPSLRHERAVIGHATSADLVIWTELPDALHPSETGWDDLALWTGSVIRGEDAVWRMFYTALRRNGHGIRDQRIGFVESDDLSTWRRTSSAPAVEVDSSRYQTLAVDPTASETWRDPFVFADPDGDGWHMLITARLRDAPRHEDGVLAHARSEDLVSWTVTEPVSNRAGFGQIEVPQVRLIQGKYVLIFTCHPEEQSHQWKRRFPHFCTWSVVGDSPIGPWDLTTAKPFLAEPDLFAAPVVRRRDGSWVIVGFRNLEPRGIDAFELLDPIEVTVEHGALTAVASVVA